MFHVESCADDDDDFDSDRGDGKGKVSARKRTKGNTYPLQDFLH